MRRGEREIRRTVVQMIIKLAVKCSSSSKDGGGAGNAVEMVLRWWSSYRVKDLLLLPKLNMHLRPPFSSSRRRRTSAAAVSAATTLLLLIELTAALLSLLIL